MRPLPDVDTAPYLDPTPSTPPRGARRGFGTRAIPVRDVAATTGAAAAVAPAAGAGAAGAAVAAAAAAAGAASADVVIDVSDVVAVVAYGDIPVCFAERQRLLAPTRREHHHEVEPVIPC